MNGIAPFQLKRGAQEDKSLKINKMTAGPVSRILSALAGGTVIPLRRTSLPGCCDLPGTHPRRAGACRNFFRTGPLFGLAPCGVCPAPFITKRAVRSYRTFSPLPRQAGAVYFLWHFPSTGLETSLPDVIRHTALRSSDFPLPPVKATATVRSGCQLDHYIRSSAAQPRFTPAGCPRLHLLF